VSGPHPLRRDQNGSVGFEIAMALPILIALMVGILQVGMVLAANGAMRNALGEGLRLAKVDPTATETQVLTRTRQALVGVEASAIDTLTFDRAITNNVRRGTISLTITLNPIIPFAPIPPIVLTETKQIYLPN